MAAAHVLDYVLYAVMMALGVAQGIYVSCRKRHGHDVSREAFLGDRSLGVLPLAVSVLVSTASPLGLVALTAHFYAYGLHLAWNLLITVAAVPLVVYCVVPVFYRLGVTSVFEASAVKGFPRPAGPTRVRVKCLYKGTCAKPSCVHAERVEVRERALRKELSAGSDNHRAYS
ncbi:hypothetical protein HPB51_018487 [Rhipicephalus microplus]|uniref:Sodium-dependent multivitamin transporter n=1 Tax=Rhipicephalus microplus TaxID=6941 RepID=A0A9J6EIZ7_RHIMP|nr:sodium-dependent multivitamin transporter-like [Rhipicephalus microplus]KAH8033976.1 hypothetical protein HPB51_018487 [Rhipicephalus microplus]